MILKEIRKAKGMSQDELAEITGIHKMQISRMERGNTDIKNATLTNALKLADALGVDPHIFLLSDTCSEDKGKFIPGYVGLYSVTEDGSVYSHTENKYMQPRSNDYYLQVYLKDYFGRKQYQMVHRLVAETYIPNPNKLTFVHHVDANKLNNHVSNLRWVTQKENVHECIKNGNFGMMNRQNT